MDPETKRAYGWWISIIAFFLGYAMIEAWRKQ